MSFDAQIIELVQFNPPRQIKRGVMAPFVDMASLSEHQRDICSVAEREFQGGGSRFKNGDTLFARITPCLENGKTAKVNVLSDDSVAHGSTEFIVMAAKDPEYDEDYIYYLARHPEFRAFAESRMEGTSGRQRVSWQALSEFSFSFPSPIQRKVVGAFLRKIDDKIALNRQINQTLVAMAQAIFKSWFVDFDPVEAKIAAIEAGQDPLRAAMSTISGKNNAELDAMPRQQYDELALTAALFPEELVESELGDVPKGWEVKPISDVANIVMGQSPDGESYNNSGDGMALINGPVEFGSYHPKRIKWTTQITRISQVGDLIVCVRGSTTGRFVKSDGIYCLGRGVCAIRAHKSDWQPFVDQTYHFSLTALLSLATGSTFPSWNGPTLKNYRVLLPSSDLITRFSTALHPISSQISINEGASTVLSELRDTLLPKLLSGELSVADIEEAV